MMNSNHFSTRGTRIVLRQSSRRSYSEGANPRRLTKICSRRRRVKRALAAAAEAGLDGSKKKTQITLLSGSLRLFGVHRDDRLLRDALAGCGSRLASGVFISIVAISEERTRRGCCEHLGHSKHVSARLEATSTLGRRRAADTRGGSRCTGLEPRGVSIVGALARSKGLPCSVGRGGRERRAASHQRSSSTTVGIAPLGGWCAALVPSRAFGLSRASIEQPSNLQMEPTRPPVCAIMSPRRAAHLKR